jgi:hypothetical protein
MANLLRRRIRDRIKTDLTGLSTTGANIFIGRTYPVEESKLPCLLIYETSEVIEQGTVSVAGTRTMISTLEVSVEGYAQGGDGETVLNTLAGIQKEVQIAMAADPSIGSLAMDAIPTGAEISLSSEGKKPTGSNRVTYQIEYAFAENAPDVPTGTP